MRLGGCQSPDAEGYLGFELWVVLWAQHGVQKLLFLGLRVVLIYYLR